MAARSLEAPGYLPAIAVAVLPWARTHVARVQRVYGLGPDDLWDETITALLRAAHYYDPARGTTFRHYAQRAVNRACWRYVVRGSPLRPALAGGDGGDAGAPVHPSPEAILTWLEASAAMPPPAATSPDSSASALPASRARRADGRAARAG